MSSRRAFIFVAILLASRGQELPAQTGIALVRDALTINASVDGSVEQMTAEPVTLNGNAIITGDLLVPGTPTLQLRGNPVFGGTLAGTGLTTPSSQLVTLNGNVCLGHLRIHMDPILLQIVSAPNQPVGTRSVSLNSTSQPPGDFATLCNLTLDGNAGQVTVPPGVYGDFSSNGSSGFTFGVAGATQPAFYAFQHLTLNGISGLRVAGPVIITLANGFSTSGLLGTAAHPEWLVIKIASGDFTLNGAALVNGYVVSSAGTITINGNSQLTGGLISGRLAVNGGGLLRLANLPPSVGLTAPADGTVVTAPASALTLQAASSDVDGVVMKVEFFAAAAKLGEAIAPPYRFTWANVVAGTYALTAKATDNAGGTTTSAPITLVVNAPPSVSLTAPDNHAVFAALGSFTLGAIASDSDGTVSKVEFFQDSAKIGEVATAPYQFSVSGLAEGSHTFTAKAPDNYGASTTSTSVSIFVDTPPVASLTAPEKIGAGQSVSLSATATDADGTVAKVELYCGGILIGTLTTATDSPSNYAFVDSSPLTPGSYSYYARTYDNSGIFTDSTPVIVSILATLPYTADFELSEGYSSGSLNGQLGWTGKGPAFVTGDGFFSGMQSVSLQPAMPPAQITQMFAPPTSHNIIFVDFFARPVAEMDLVNSTIFDVGSSRFAFLCVGTNGVLYAFNGDGAGGGQWVETRFILPLGPDNQTQSWIRLTGRVDFVRKTYDLYANGSIVAADVNFATLRRLTFPRSPFLAMRRPPRRSIIF